ncbi:hypothetical protein V7x_22140 [Crateriforma conspicua]|uniref:Carbohydrate-binding domain-containing protein n=1 Tax=Crateriforma conspicua TaxID=2527996 RepID=A0A5C6FWD4_9PLAN|nr:hypothetical protein V7x_22140 [Crateriforma conspicua]
MRRLDDRRRQSISVCIGWLLFCFPTLASADQPDLSKLPVEALQQTENLIANPSFENGWDQWTPPKVSHQVAKNQWESEPYEDYQWIRQDSLDGQQHVQIRSDQSQTISFSPRRSVKVYRGCTYRFQISYRRQLVAMEPSRTTPSLRVIFHDADGNATVNDPDGKYYVYHDTRDKSTNTDAWTSATYTFTVNPNSNVDRVNLSVFLYDQGTIAFDGAAFYNDTARGQSEPTEPTTQWVALSSPTVDKARPQIGIRPKSGPLTIDGRSDDAGWQSVRPLSLVRSIDGGKSSPTTTFQVTRDADAIYFFARAVETGQESHRHGSDLRNDLSIHNHDCIDLFLQPDPASGTYFQITMNPKGGLVTRKWNGRDNEVPWVPSDVEIAGHIDFDYWTVEAAIPLDALGAAKPLQSSTWAANVCRAEVPGTRNWNAWSYTGGDFHHPNRFGWFRFVDPSSAAADMLSTVKGTVLDTTGKPLAGIPINAMGRIERTNADGVFRFEDVAIGTHRFAVLSPLHEPLQGDVSVKRDFENIAPIQIDRRDPFRVAFDMPQSDQARAAQWLSASLTEPPAMDQPSPQITSMELIAARGETKAFAVSALVHQDLASPSVQLSELKSNDSVIGPADVSVRWVQRMLQPVHYQGPKDDAVFVWRFLWDEPPATLSSGQLRLLVGTINIPADAPAGTYTGQFTLRSADQSVATLPVSLRVGDFELRSPDKRAGAFLNISKGSLFQAGPQWESVVMQDMADHQATTMHYWAGISFGSDGNPVTRAAEQSLRLQQQYGMKPPYSIKFSVEQLAQVLGVEFLDRHAIDIESLKAKETEFREAVQRGVAAVVDLEKQFGLPANSLVLFWSDEVFIGQRLEPWIYTAKIVRQYTDNPIGLTFDPRDVEKWDRVEPLVDVPFFHGRNLDLWSSEENHSYDQLHQRIDASGDVPFAYYNIIRTSITPEYARLVNGYWLWQTPVHSQMHWTYYWGDQDAMVGVREGDRIAPFFALAAPHPSRPQMLSTLDWENLREGVTDHRYVVTLEHAIERAGPDKKATVDRAKRFLDSLRQTGPVVDDAARQLDAADYTKRRTEMHRLISELMSQ